MKKKALNYIFYTLAFFSLFFWKNVFALEYTTIPNNTFVCPTLSGNTAYAVYPATTTPPYTGITVNSHDNVAYAGITCNGTSVNNLQGNISSITIGNYVLVYGQAPSNIWNGTSGDIYYGSFYWNGVSISNNYSATTTSSQIFWFTSPDWNTEGSNATSTTNIEFTYNFYINSDELDNYNEACVFYEKVNIGTTTNATASGNICQNITSSGNQIFSKNVTLENNSLYSYYGIILGTGTTPYNQRTLSQELQIGVVYGSGIVPASYLDFTTATSTGFLQFLNVPNLLKTKAPFAYLPEMWNMLTNASSTATSQLASSTLSLTLASGTPMANTISIDFFSENVFRKYLTSGTITLFRNLLAYVVFASTIWFVYHDIKKRRVI